MAKQKSAQKEARKTLERLAAEKHWTVTREDADALAVISQAGDEENVLYSEQPTLEELEALAQAAAAIEPLEGWPRTVALDSLCGLGFRERWESLIESVRDIGEIQGRIDEFKEAHAFETGYKDSWDDYEHPLRQLQETFEKKGKIGYFDLRNKDVARAYGFALIDGEAPNSTEDFSFLMDLVLLEQAQNKTSEGYNHLFHHFPEFSGADGEAFEAATAETAEAKVTPHIEAIENALGWEEATVEALSEALEGAGIWPADVLGDFEEAETADENEAKERLETLESAAQDIIPALAEALSAYLILEGAGEEA